MKNVGRYVVISELGRGAMGVVYRASDPTIGREVALKVLSLSASPEEGTNSPQQMFMREVRAAGRLAHPSIVTIHDAFDDQENQTSCIVMELVPGVTLEKILESGQALTTEQALNLVRQVAEGLDYAHRNHVIHRDLKPANILVTDDGRAKITDFGIAKVLAREGVARTVGVMGTPSYMSPEQVRGGEVDARTDIFSLGIIIFTMLSGRKPFSGNTAAVMFKIVYEEPPLPSSFNPELTPAHDYVIGRCLAKDRNLRYSSAREFLADLDDLQHGRSPRSQATAPAPPAAAPRPPAAPLRQDRTLAMPIPELVKAAAQVPVPRTVPPPPPAAPPKRVAAPAKPAPPAAPMEAVGPVAPPSVGKTMVRPIPGLMKGIAGPPAPQVVSTPTALPPVPAQAPNPVTPPPFPDARPLTGSTLPMHVPDLSAASTQALFSPAVPVPPAPPDSSLMEGTLPMQVPEISEVEPAAPPSPAAEPMPSFDDQPTLLGHTTPMQVADIAAVPPPAPSSPSPIPEPPPPPGYPLMEEPGSMWESDLSAESPAAEPQPATPAPYAEYETAAEEIPGEALPAPKGKLIPVALGVSAVFLLAAAILGYWGFHRSKTAPWAPPPVVVQTPPVTPPPAPAPAPTPVESPTPPPAVVAEQPPPPVSPAPEVTKKTAAHRPKQAAGTHPAATAPAAAPTAQPQPAAVTPPPRPSAPTPGPPTITRAETPKVTNIPRIVQVVCDYGFKEATFTFSSGGQTLFEGTLKGKKRKGGFLGIKGSYEGTFSHTITVPAGAGEVSVRVVAKEGAEDLRKTIKMPPPGGFVPTLAVEVDSDNLSLMWKGSAAAK
jgi:serine/threonine-protein kinase